MNLSALFHPFIIVVLLCLAGAVQSQNPTKLELNQILTVTLPATKHEKYSISITKQPSSSQYLFVTAESPFNDPFQQPYMTITTTSGFQMSCDDQSSSYTGICKVDQNQVQPGKQLILEVYCLADCTLKIAAYIDDIYKLELGKGMEISSMATYGLAELIKIEVPDTLDFSSILILCRLENYDVATEGVSLYANYGSNTTVPSEISYMVKAQPTYGHRLSMEISSSSLQAGDDIILYLFLGVNNTVQLSTYVVDDSITTLRIGGPIVDFTSEGETKKYIADLQDYKGLDLQNKDIMVKFIIYSGSPEIKLSFDQNFTDVDTQDNWFIESSFVYLLSPAFRREKNFINKLYISVESFFLASFYLELIVNTKNFILLSNNIMQLTKIVPDGVQNFIFEDENYADEVEEGGLVRYKATIQMIQGSIEIGIRDCDSLMDTSNTNVEGCLITNISQMSDPDIKKSFDNIQGELKKFYNTYEVVFYYNVTRCPKVSVGTHLERYVCDYHIIIHNIVVVNSHPQDGYLGIELTKYSQPRVLKEGIILKDTVPEQEYNYYSFELPSVENISKIQIYTTVIEGDITMLVSRKQKFPDFNEVTSGDVKINIFGHDMIEGQRLTNGIYYIGIYGYEITDYTISVAVQRGTNNSTNNTDVTEIKLKKGLTQSFTMGKGKDLMKFSITSTKAEATVIQIDSIKGTIAYEIVDKVTPVLICDSSSQSVGPDGYCKFTSKANNSYVITVRGSKQEIDSFVISYSNEETCNSYPIDIPMYLSLRLSSDTDDDTCFNFDLLQIEDIEITVAMSDIDKIKAKGYLAVNLQFKATNKSITLDDYEQIITKQQLQVFCPPINSSHGSSPSGSSSKCQFELKVKVNSSLYRSQKPNKNQSIELMIAVQGFDDENVLFDGIPEKLITNKISDKKGKHFYYYIYNIDRVQDLNIYLTTQTNSNYQVVGRVIDDTRYARDYDGVEYPSFNSNATDVLLANSTQYSPITALTIKKQLLSKKTPNSNTNIVLISVFGISPTPDQTYIFKIQATSTSTFLAYGESKLGYVDKDQIYEYEVDIDSSTPSIVTVRPLGLEKCMQSYVLVSQFVKQSAQDEGRIIETTVQFDKIRTFNSQSGNRKILIKGVSNQMCTYQISHDSLNSPLKVVAQGVPYEIKIETFQATSYYLYHSHMSQSLHIIQMINGGNSILYALPIPEESDESIQDLLNKNVENFVWKGELNANLHIDKAHTSYCNNCYYLIAVRGKNIVNGQLIVNTESLPIPLKQGSILKDKLGQNKTNSYLFYSTTSFNVTLTPIYGHLNVLIVLPAMNGQPSSNVRINDVSSSKEIAISVPSSPSQSNRDYFDANARFIVNITATKDSYYYVGVKKLSTGTRIFEGMPSNLQIQGQATVSFVNYDKEQPINILVQNLQYDESQSNSLSFEASKINHQGVVDSAKVDNIIEQKLESEGSYNIRLYSQVADYIIKITAQRPTNISIILAKVSLTHLVAARNVMLTNPAIFQIFSPGESIMIEIFSCAGEIEVIASSNYTQIINNSFQNVVRMEHSNYGGHYVISSEDLKGDYYVQTKSLDPQGTPNTQLSYLISYYLYTSNEKMPYKAYGIMKSYIEYSYKPGKVEYSLNKIYRKDLESATGEAVYKLYISNSSQEINRMTSCSVGKVYSQLVTESNAIVTSNDKGQFVTFSLKESELRDIIGSSSVYYVGGEASFKWPVSKPHHAKSVTFVYDTSQMVTGNQPEFKNSSKTDNTFFVLLWIVVPFAIGSFVFYLAIKYFINSVRQGPNQLIEEDVGESQEVFGNQPPASSDYQYENKPPVDHQPDKYAIE